MNKFQKLVDRCKCGVYLTVNGHRDNYDSIDMAIVNHLKQLEAQGNIPDLQMLKKIREKDNFIELQFYPDNSVASYSVYHYDLDLALDEALEILEIK